METCQNSWNLGEEVLTIDEALKILYLKKPIWQKRNILKSIT
jgi:hypothetical protein